jgi:integrase
MTISKCIGGVELRGNIYYLRWRVPAVYRDIEPRTEINQTLKTWDLEEARALAFLKKKALRKVWDAKLLNQNCGPSVEVFGASIALLDELNLPYVPIEGLLSGPLEELVTRIEKLASIPADSPVVAAALGVCDMPHVKILEMPKILEKRWDHKVRSKNADQKRQWRNRYLHAAKTFDNVVSNKNIHEITEEDALRYFKYWQERVNSGTITDDLAVKRLRYLRQMIAEYHELAGTLPSKVFNPVADFKIKPMPKKIKSSNEGGKRALPVRWVKSFVAGDLTAEMKSEEAIDIGITIAETGCRQTEIVHLPPEDIVLDHAIPHLRIRYVEEGEHARDIKNSASIRVVPLLGAALDAMRRNPTGFPKYRGKGNFSGTINKFLRENNAFPEEPEGQKQYTFGGTRHTFEDRGRAARLTNEERAFLLGHSVGKLRGRPVYGDGPQLKLRALYAELLTFPTKSWCPRPQKEIWQVIDEELEAQGYRTE